MPSTRPVLATVVWGLALLAVLGAVLGPLAIQVGLAAPYLGFRIFTLSLLLSVPVLLASGVALLLAQRSPDGAGRRLAWRAAGLSGVLVLLFLVLALPARRVPPINDISTDLEDPPRFLETVSAVEYADRGAGYPVEFAQPQQAAYPDLGPIRLAEPPEAAYARAQRTAQALGWEIVRADPAALELEASDTSRIFRFVDDVAVRVRPDGAGSRVDVRSRSRVGRSDVGANAARIRAFRDALEGGTR